MKKDDKIKLTKISDDVFNGKHPNDINEGYTKFGFLVEPPTVGERFKVRGTTLTSGLLTSIVTEIIDENTFKTENSTYRIELCDFLDIDVKFYDDKINSYEDNKKRSI